ncbi:hypothetical protein [Pontimicrobium sp. MEBiC01747]
MKSILIFIFIILSINSYSQKLTIEELIVSDIKYENNSKIINEGNGNGPHIRVVLTLYNDTNKDIFLDINSAKIELYYKKNGIKYSGEMIWDPVFNPDKEKVSPNTVVNLETSTYIFLGTDIWKEKKTDYTLELLEVLPTLKMKYIDKNYQLLSIDIKNVKIKGSRW